MIAQYKVHIACNSFAIGTQEKVHVGKLWTITCYKSEDQVYLDSNVLTSSLHEKYFGGSLDRVAFIASQDDHVISYQKIFPEEVPDCIY